MNEDFASELMAAIKGEYIPRNQRKFTQQLESALSHMNNSRQSVNQRIQKAIASHYPKTQMTGMVKAIAQRKNPLQLELDMVLLVLDKPNGNRQGVKRSESQNILDTARYAPLRANFDGKRIKGHDNTDDIGTLIDVWLDGDMVMGKAVLWLDRNEDVATFLQKQDAIYNSFEMYYQTYTMESGIQWLNGCMYTASALVATPAYTEARVKLV